MSRVESRRVRGFGWVVVLALGAALSGCGARAVTPWCPEFDADCDPQDAGVDVPRVDVPRVDVPRLDAIDVPEVPDAPDVPDVPEVGVDAPRCEPGRTLCEGRCVSTSDDPAHCGGCGQRCAPVPGGSATCVMGVCGFACLPGQHACGTTCVPDDSPLTCGTSCTPCSAPMNARATCGGGRCGWECNVGFVRVGERCELSAPRPIAPLSTATVTSQQPTLRYELPAGADGATVEICRDRAFTQRCQTVATMGTAARPTLALERGVWFWRLWARGAGGPGLNASAVWQFTVGARTAPVDASHGTTLDVNGDGYADLAVSASGAMGPGARVHVYLGSARGISTTPALSLPALEPNSAGQEVVLANAGDVNGDGYADLAVGAPGALVNTGRVHLYLGSAAGPGAMPAFSLTGTDGSSSEFGTSLAGAGDFNGDGYADLVVGAPGALAQTGRVHVYVGGATGLSATPQLTLAGPDGGGGRFGWSLTSSGDLDGDGFADLVVAAQPVRGDTRRIQVYSGSVRGLGSAPSASFTRPASPGTRFGWWVTQIGDLNGDGLGDFAVGVPGDPGGRGWVEVYFGRAAGPYTSPTFSLLPRDVNHLDFGVARAGAGDYDGDGFADLALGAAGVAGQTGQVDVWPGRAGGMQVGIPLRLVGPDGPGGEFGGAVAVRRAPRVGPMRGARLARVERGQR